MPCKPTYTVFVYIVVAAFLACPICATDPFPNTFIVREGGKWKCPRQFTRDLIIVNRDDSEKHILQLKTLFPGNEYSRNVSDTTAGPLWGQAALYYIFESNGTDFFTMHTAAGTRLLVNLSTGALDNVAVDAANLKHHDRKEIVGMLKAVTETLQTKSGFDEQKLYGALRLAASYNMVELIPEIEIIEERGWHGPMGWNSNYSYSPGLQPEVESSTFYKLNQDRRHAQLAIRRLGRQPRGFGQYQFENNRNDVPLPIASKAASIFKLRQGQKSGQVHKLIGPPDYIMSAVENAPEKPSAHRARKWTGGWRYDFGGALNYSVLILWDDNGKIVSINQISPGLWNENGVFENGSEIIQCDGDVNGIHLYGDRFVGKNNEIRFEPKTNR